MARKRDVLRTTAPTSGPGVVELTHLSTTLVGSDDRELAASIERLRPRRQSAADYAAAVNAGTVEDHIARFRHLAEAGVAEVMIRLPDLTDAEPLARMGHVISAFR